MLTPVTQGFERMSVADRQSLEQKMALPLRPSAGSLGKAIRLYANYFAVNDLPVGEIVQYDVSVQPEVPRALSR